MNEVTKKLYTTKELAEYLNVHVATVRNWENTGKIVPIKKPGEYKKFDIEKVLIATGRKLKDSYSCVYINKFLLTDSKKIDIEESVAKQYCAANGLRYKIFIDEPFDDNLGDTMDNFISCLLYDNVENVIVNKESSLGFTGSKIIKSICNQKNIPFIAIEELQEKNRDFIYNNITTAIKLCEIGCNKNKLQFSKIKSSLDGALDALC